MSPCRVWLQMELMEVAARSRWPWGTKVKSRAHDQKGYEIDLDDYFCTEYKSTPVGVVILLTWNNFALTGLLWIILMPFAVWNIWLWYILSDMNRMCNSYISVIRCHIPLFLSSTVPHCILFSISHVDSESISLKNLKRRSEFFEKGKKKRRSTRCWVSLNNDNDCVIWWLGSLCFCLAEWLRFPRNFCMFLPNHSLMFNW